MKLETLIFIGRSGCGKGTQAKLVDEYLKKKDPEHPLYHLETGSRFRNFISHEGYTNKLARVIMDQGRRQPDFLAVWMWANHFIENLDETKHLIIDGTPRSLNEAHILDGGLSFYGRVKPHVVHLNVSREWSEARLMARGRADDNHADIKERLDWYTKDVEPAVEYYRTNPTYNFIEINGEQPIEVIHEELMKQLKL